MPPTAAPVQTGTVKDALQDESRMPVLVTGGAGFVGSNLCRRLLEKGYEVYAVDNFITGRKSNIVALLEDERFHFTEMDVCDAEFRKKFSDIPVKEIYHFACPTGVPNISILSMEMLNTCSIGTFHALEIAKTHGAKFIFTSSCEVYGQPEVFPQVPTYNGNVSPIGPRAPYEEGKRFSESIIITYVRKFDVDAKILRLFNVYGPGMSPEDQRVLPQFIKAVVEGKKLPVYGDGLQTRTLLYIDDLIRGIETVMDNGSQGEVYNIGSDVQTPIKDLAQMVIDIMNHDQGIDFLPHFIEDHNRRQPDTSLLNALGWNPEVELADGLKRMIDYQKKYEFDMHEVPVMSTVSA